MVLILANTLKICLWQKYNNDGDEDDNNNTDDGDKHDDVNHDDDNNNNHNDDNHNNYNNMVMLISEVVHSSRLPNIFCNRKVASSKGRVFQLPSNNN